MIPDKSTFCIAPFKHAQVNSRGFLKICCVSEENQQYKFNEIEDWHQSHVIKNLRKNLISGVKDPICENCWKKESSGVRSQRSVYNKHIGKILEEHWDKNFKNNINLVNEIENVDSSAIQSFDLQLGNLCNLKCIMCGPDRSSQIMSEIKLHPELSKLYDFDLTGDLEYANKEDFNAWCKKYLENSIHLKFTGGEPFLNPYLLKVLEHIPDSQKKKCILHFSTNLTRINQKILDLFDKFKETWISVSVEGIGDVLEYARFPHKWNDLEANLAVISGRKKVFVSVSHVVQAPTFSGIMDLIKYFDKLKIKLDPIFLTTPTCFHLHSIKTSAKQKFIDEMESYDGQNTNFVSAVNEFCKSNIDYNEKLAHECVNRLQALDRVRGTDFTECIPIDMLV